MKLTNQNPTDTPMATPLPDTHEYPESVDTPTGRTVSTAPPPQTYMNYRLLGTGRLCAVRQVHKVPVAINELVKAIRSTKVDTVESVVSKINLLINKTPDKPDSVPGIREIEKKQPIKRLHASRLLAEKKVLLSNSSNPKDLREYQLLKQLEQLEHPNIIRLVDSELTPVSESSIQATLWTEAGISNLASVTQDAGEHPLPARTVGRLMGDLLSAVTHLHEQEITHNDLKPQNIVLMPDMTAKVIDLESAWVFKDGTSQTKGFNYTGMYAAPEITTHQNQKQPTFTDLKSNDYWAMGCILFELVTGERLEPLPPEKGEPVPSVFARNWADRFPSTLPGWQDNELTEAKAALAQLLHLRPEQRSTEQLATFVRHYQLQN